MKIEENTSLLPYNTFQIDCKARYFVSVNSIAELKAALEAKIHPELFLLGGGSNMLLTQDIDALVIHINLKGISVVEETEDEVLLEVMAGENWHEFVTYCIDHNYGGIENLSLIPGNVGTAPIQNIGAYGVELADVFVRCSVLEISSGEELEFSKQACEFGYRDSIFKQEAKGELMITKVVLRLRKKDHILHTSYGAIESQLSKMGITEPTIQTISEAVIAIRKSKLPDPAEIGNSGSFFKNPVISAASFEVFSERFPEAPFYRVSDDAFKIPAGWLIEQAGFKGKRFGDAGVHDKQALVLVNHGNATGREIWALALQIQKTVREDFDIEIVPEVNVF